MIAIRATENVTVSPCRVVMGASSVVRTLLNRASGTGSKVYCRDGFGVPQSVWVDCILGTTLVGRSGRRAFVVTDVSRCRRPPTIPNSDSVEDYMEQFFMALPK